VDHANQAALLEAVRRGDEAAFARLYAAYQGPIYRYALHMCGAPAADDVVQETFLALLHGERFDPGRGTVSAYLFGIARHHILRRIAAAQREAPAGDEVAEAATIDEGVPEGLSRAEAIAAVRAAVRSLPPVYREVVTLCELEELDYAAAAAVLECPLGTVRSRLHRAKALLTAKLRREGQERQEGRERRDGQNGHGGYEGHGEPRLIPAARQARVRRG
jgi:RNA polymerase sigma-70 factor (ECF subfamily)